MTTMPHPAGAPGPPTGARVHLKIEKDGRLINRATAPDLPEKGYLCFSFERLFVNKQKKIEFH